MLIEIIITDTHLNVDNVEVNQSIHKQAAQHALQNKIPRVLHMGDIFDSRENQSLKTLLAFKSILDMYESLGITLVAIPGNHDKVDYDSDKSYLEIYNSHANFQLINSPQKISSRHHSVVDIYMCPYYKETTTYPLKLQSLSVEKSTNPSILLTHISIEGVKNNDGSTIEGSHAPQMSLFDAFDKVFIGHYHNAQSLRKGKYIYTGSSMPHNFGETNDKGIVGLSSDLTWSLLDTEFPHYYTVPFRIGEDDADVFIADKMAMDQGYYRIETIGSSIENQAFDRTIFTKHGIAVKRRNIDIDNNIQFIKTSNFEAHNFDSLKREFDIFCADNQICGEDKELGFSYVNILQDVAF